MTVHCADCKAYICRRGGPMKATPNFCPMRGDFPDFEELYAEGESLRFLSQSALVEAGGYCRWTRLEEVAEFCRAMGFRRFNR